MNDQLIPVLNTIKLLRLSKGIEQIDMADGLGIAQPSYNRLEKGRSILNLNQIFKIAEILEVRPSELLEVDLLTKLMQQQTI